MGARNLLFWKCIVSLCCTCCLGVAYDEASFSFNQPTFKGLKFIGTYSGLASDAYAALSTPEARSATTLTSEYFISIDQLTFPEAKAKCPMLTGGRGGLVNIENRDEDNKIHHLILQQGVRASDDLYWTDGVSDEKGDWVWSSTGTEIGPYKHFLLKPGPGGYLAFKSTSSTPESFEWLALYDRRERHNYICEVPVQAERVAVPCKRKNDLIIILDGSGSVDEQDYTKATEFAAKLASAFISPSRVSFLTYDTDVHVKFGLGKNLSGQKAQDSISAHIRENPKGMTYTGGAIEMAVRELKQNGRKTHSSKVVVLTDGHSSWPKKNPIAYTAAAAKKAKADEVTMFSVGIGIHATNSVFREELLTIAGNVGSNSFIVNDFDALLNKVREIGVRICMA